MAQGAADKTKLKVEGKSTAATKTAAKKSTAKTTTAKKPTAKSVAQQKTGKDLIIVESPTKAKKISKFLGDKYNVIASNGHVRDLPKSTLGVDVEKNFEPKYITVRGRGDLIDKIKRDAKIAPHVYLATDPDREGEAISWHLAALLNIDEKKASRIVFNEITVSAVKNALKNARAIDMNLVNAQQARRVLDRLVGYKISPLLWRKVRKGLSAGRVQSVATRLVCDREDEINAFVSEEYWTVAAQLKADGVKKAVIARYFGVDGKKVDLHNEAEANEVINKAKAATFVINDIKKAQKNRHAPAPFTTSSLQQEASRKLAFTADKTMKIAQELYEGASFDSGLITYMRTDSVRVAKEAQTSALELIAKKYGADYVPATPNFYKGKAGAQDAHEAIRPTDFSATPEKIAGKLTPQQNKLYRLIYERFMASQMSDAVIEATTVTYDVDGLTFKTTGQRTVFDGYTVIYNDTRDEAKDVTLPKLEEGDKLAVIDVEGEQHFTQPPARYTDATLVKALDDLGIGRPSTYAPTISTIIARGYVLREKRILYPTDLGGVVTGIMKEHFKNIVDVKFTAKMEDDLDKVEEGEVEWKHIISEFYTPFQETVELADTKIERVVIPDEVSDIPCDKCGTLMVYKEGRFGKFLACPKYPECKNTKPVMQKIDVPCPKCGAAIVKRNGRTKGKYFYGCEKYPECDYVSWNMPLKEKCSTCGAMMVQVLTKRGRYKACSNENCATNQKKKTHTSEKKADNV